MTRTKGFNIVIICLTFFSLIPIIRGIMGLSGFYLTGAPNSFFIFNIITGIALLICTYLIYDLRKIGVILYPIIVLIEITVHGYFGYELFDSYFTLFFYIGFAMLEIVPNWKYYH